jgi:hypothetical protein
LRVEKGKFLIKNGELRIENGELHNFRMFLSQNAKKISTLFTLKKNLFIKVPLVARILLLISLINLLTKIRVMVGVFFCY